MTNTVVLLAVLLLGMAAPSLMAQDHEKQSAAQDDDALRGIRFSGQKVEPEELADSEPRQIIGRDDLANFFSGEGLQCKNGALRAGYSHADGFIFDDGNIQIDAVIAEVKRRHGEGRLSCFFVESAEYDRSAFDRLVGAIGTGSVVWNDPPTPAGAGVSDRTQEQNRP